MATHEVVVTIEEASIGGLGAHVLTLASDEGLTDAGLKIRTMRLPDRSRTTTRPTAIRRGKAQRAAHRRDRALGAAPQQRRRGGSASLNGAAPRRRLRMILVWLLAAAVAGYLALVALLAVNQAKLIYPAPPARGVPSGFAPIALRTADGLALTAGYRPARKGLPTVLFFHGNGMVWPDGPT
jgi:hypothetical protein